VDISIKLTNIGLTANITPIVLFQVELWGARLISEKTKAKPTKNVAIETTAAGKGARNITILP